MSANELDDFFRRLTELGEWYTEQTGVVPNELAVNPDIIGKLSKIEGFYQRPELRGMVTAHAPVVRYMTLDFGVVMLVDDWSEDFLRFEHSKK